MKTIESLIEFCEKYGFGFSVARASGVSQFTVFIHTTIPDDNEKVISKFYQSTYLEDAIGMSITVVELLLKKQKKS